MRCWERGGKFNFVSVNVVIRFGWSLRFLWFVCGWVGGDDEAGGTGMREARFSLCGSSHGWRLGRGLGGGAVGQKNMRGGGVGGFEYFYQKGLGGEGRIGNKKNKKNKIN